MTPKILTLEEMAEEYARWHSSVICMERAIAPHYLAGARAALNMAEVKEMRNMLSVYQRLAEKDLLTYERQRQFGTRALAAFDQLMKGVE